MHYEIVSSIVQAASGSDDATRQALLEAVAVFEQALCQRGLAAIVQVRDLRIGRTVHEAVFTGHLAEPPPCNPAPAPCPA